MIIIIRQNNIGESDQVLTGPKFPSRFRGCARDDGRCTGPERSAARARWKCNRKVCNGLSSHGRVPRADPEARFARVSVHVSARAGFHTGARVAGLNTPLDCASGLHSTHCPSFSASRSASEAKRPGSTVRCPRRPRAPTPADPRPIHPSRPIDQPCRRRAPIASVLATPLPRRGRYRRSIPSESRRRTPPQQVPQNPRPPLSKFSSSF